MEPKYYAEENGCLKLVYVEYPLTSLVYESLLAIGYEYPLVYESLLIIELEIVGVPFFEIIGERE